MVERSSFALACVMAVAGLVPAVGTAGCSSDAESVAPSADAGGVSDAGSATKGDTSRVGICPRTESIDVSSLPFKPPRVLPGACSNDDLAFFFVTVGAGAAIPQMEQLMKERNSECAACIFGAADADTWAPIVMTGDDEHIENVGGCFAVVSKNDACGKAFQETTRCLETACGSCYEEELEACSSGVRDEGGVCAESFTDYLIECGPDPDAIMRACVTGRTYMVEGSIARQCGGAKPDGGTP